MMWYSFDDHLTHFADLYSMDLRFLVEVQESMITHAYTTHYNSLKYDRGRDKEELKKK
jgi:hypothetical protein